MEATTTTTTTDVVTPAELAALAAEAASITGEPTTAADLTGHTFYRIPTSEFDPGWVADRAIIEIESNGFTVLAEAAPENTGPQPLAHDVPAVARFEAWAADAGTQTMTAGDGDIAAAGYKGTATAGDGGTATAGYGGAATVGVRGTATAGYGGTATAGHWGIIQIYWLDDDRRRIVTGYVGEGIEPNTRYRLDDNGNFERADNEPNLKGTK